MTTTPEQFLHLWTASLEERGAAPCVPLERDCIHLMRSGQIGHCSDLDLWFADGASMAGGRMVDNIASISFKAVLAELVASRARIKELERGVLDGLSQWGQVHEPVAPCPAYTDDHADTSKPPPWLDGGARGQDHQGVEG